MRGDLAATGLSLLLAKGTGDSPLLGTCDIANEVTASCK